MTLAIIILRGSIRTPISIFDSTGRPSKSIQGRISHLGNNSILKRSGMSIAAIRKEIKEKKTAP